MTRGKRLLSLLLSVLMLCTLLPPRASAAPTLYFTAVNDRMCDLSDETMPFWQNGLLYVAGATVDGPDDLGIRYSYNQEKSVAILYKYTISAVFATSHNKICGHCILSIG